MKLVCSFDDGTVEDMVLADILVKHGLEEYTTLFWPVMGSVANEPKGRTSLSNDQMNDLASLFKIGSHTVTHRLLTRIPLEEARTEIVESKRLLEERFGQNIDKFCYPRGYANPDIQKIVQEAGYVSARGVGVGYVHGSENPYYEQTTVHVGCDRKEYGGKSWFDYAMYMLDLASNTANAVYNLWGHSYEIASYPGGFEKLEALLNEVSKRQ